MNRTPEEAAAFGLGWDAFDEGLCDTANPYDFKKKRNLHLCWNDGWNEGNAAQDEDENEFEGEEI